MGPLAETFQLFRGATCIQSVDGAGGAYKKTLTNLLTLQWRWRPTSTSHSASMDVEVIRPHAIILHLAGKDIASSAVRGPGYFQLIAHPETHAKKMRRLTPGSG